jgi:cell division protein FtsL
MSDQAFGLSANQVMAYASVANVLLVLILAAININYAWHAKRQADASLEQVAAATRQAEIAAETLSILRKQLDQQRTADLATVNLQLKVAMHTLEDWLKRIGSDAYPQLPDEIGILPEDFGLATQRANAIDQIVAENMGAASLYAGEAENNIRILRSGNPAEPQSWKEMQEKAKKNLSIAKYKLSVARTRWESMTG